MDTCKNRAGFKSVKFHSIFHVNITGYNLTKNTDFYLSNINIPTKAVEGPTDKQNVKYFLQGWTCKNKMNTRPPRGSVFTLSLYSLNANSATN